MDLRMPAMYQTAALKSEPARNRIAEELAAIGEVVAHTRHGVDRRGRAGPGLRIVSSLEDAKHLQNANSAELGAL
jgi:hypothetical protein